MSTATAATKRPGAGPVPAITVIAASVTALVLTSCGGEGPVTPPSPTGSLTATLPSRTVSAPTPTRSPTRSPTRGEESETPTSPPPSESASPPASTAPPPTSETPSPTPAPSSLPPSAPTSVTTSANAVPSSSPSKADETEGTDATGEGSIPSWVWWLLLAGVLLAGALAALLVPRARRRRAWDADLAGAEQEAAWFARTLLQQLQRTGSPDEAAGGWQVAAGRVTAAEDRLTGLGSTAPDESRRSRARELRDAVRAARQGVEDLIGSRDPASLTSGLGAIAARLEAALEPSAPSG